MSSRFLSSSQGSHSRGSYRHVRFLLVIPLLLIVGSFAAASSFTSPRLRQEQQVVAKAIAGPTQKAEASSPEQTTPPPATSQATDESSEQTTQIAGNATSAATTDNDSAANCDTADRDQATAAYNKAIGEENSRHQKVLAQLSAQGLFDSVQNGPHEVSTDAEDGQHATTMQGIAQALKSALQAAHCSEDN